MKTSKILKIGKYNISSTKELARLVQIKGKTKTCEFLHYMKSIVIDSDLQTETGIIKWATENGELISENGYHYSINYFL